VLIAGIALGVGLIPRLNAFTGPDFREGLVAAERPLPLDPLIGADTPAIHDVGHLLYRSLVRLDRSAYPQPDLASSYSVDQSGEVYTFELAPHQRWSDGRAITASDVVATFAFAQSKQAVDRSLSGALAGAHAKAQGSATVMFTLGAPHASFVATLTQLPILPLGAMSAKQIAAVPSQALIPMATSGPYRVQSSDAASVELVVNQFARTRPAVSRLELRLYGAFDDAAAAFAKGDVDAVLATTPTQRARLLGQTQAVAHDIATFRFVDLIFNEHVFGLDDPVVRQAVGAAVDRHLIADGALSAAGGLIETDAISRGLPWIATADPHEQPSIAAARSALDAAGWAPGPDGIRRRGGVTLAFTLLAPNRDPLPKVAAELAQQLRDVGISVSVDVVPPGAFLTQDIAPGSFQLALGDWDPGPDPDVRSFWRSNATPPAGFYVSGGAVDPFLDQALDMLATLDTRAGRVAAATSVSAHLMADAPAVFLYTPTVSYVIRGSVANESVPVVGDSAARYDAAASWRKS
jgi:peptide/nickel transport system substrate-binding protein